jgi:hypothetical protein
MRANTHGRATRRRADEHGHARAQLTRAGAGPTKSQALALQKFSRYLLDGWEAKVNRAIPLDGWYGASSLRLHGQLSAARPFLVARVGVGAPGRAKTTRSRAGWMTGGACGESHKGNNPGRGGPWGELPLELRPIGWRVDSVAGSALIHEVRGATK